MRNRVTGCGLRVTGNDSGRASQAALAALADTGKLRGARLAAARALPATRNPQPATR
jgi:hypothetical protein